MELNVEILPALDECKRIFAILCQYSCFSDKIWDSRVNGYCHRDDERERQTESEREKETTEKLEDSRSPQVGKAAILSSHVHGLFFYVQLFHKLDEASSTCV